MQPPSQNETFGKICAFMAMIPFYQALPLIAIERRVASAIARNQFIFFEDKKGHPVGYVSWILLEKEEEEDYLEDPVGLMRFSRDKLISNEKPKSANLWIMDFCGRETGAFKIVSHLKRRLAKDHPEIEWAKAVRWSSHFPFPHLRRYAAKPRDGKEARINSRPTIRKARLHDVYDLASRMRWQDREEVRLNSGRNPFEALLNSHKNSRVSNACELDGRCIGLCGLSDSAKEKDTGFIWLLSNGKLHDHPLFMAKFGKKFVAEGLQNYKKLMNYIHEDTQQDTIDWLKFLNFEFTEIIENHNQRGGKFWRFEKSNEVANN